MAKGAFKKFLRDKQFEGLDDPLQAISSILEKNQEKQSRLAKILQETEEVPQYIPPPKPKPFLEIIEEARPEPAPEPIEEIALQVKSVPKAEKDDPKEEPEEEAIDYTETLKSGDKNAPTPAPKLIDENVEKFIKEQVRDIKVLVDKTMVQNQMVQNQMGQAGDRSAGGTGSVAMQLAEGGTIRGKLNLHGGVSHIPTTITSSYTVALSDHAIFADASSGSLTVTVPAASASTGSEFHVKKIDSTGNIVTLEMTGTDTLDDVSSVNISDQYESYLMKSNGSNWYVF